MVIFLIQFYDKIANNDLLTWIESINGWGVLNAKLFSAIDQG